MTTRIFFVKINQEPLHVSQKKSLNNQRKGFLMKSNYDKEISRLITPHLPELIRIGSIYIAIIETEVDQYDVEIEVNEGSIIATYSDSLTIEEARQFADELECALKKNNVVVFSTRLSWDNFLQGNN